MHGAHKEAGWGGGGKEGSGKEKRAEKWKTVTSVYGIEYRKSLSTYSIQMKLVFSLSAIPLALLLLLQSLPPLPRISRDLLSHRDRIVNEKYRKKPLPRDHGNPRKYSRV